MTKVEWEGFSADIYSNIEAVNAIPENNERNVTYDIKKTHTKRVYVKLDSWSLSRIKEPI